MMMAIDLQRVDDSGNQINKETGKPGDMF